MTSSNARSRLAALAAAAGYPPDLLEQIKTATLPRARGRLTDREIRQLTEAVGVLAHNAYTAETVRILLDHYQRRYGEQWRERFWAGALRIANARHQHHELHNRPAAHTAARTTG